MTVRYGVLNIRFMHQTFGGTPRFLVVETSQTVGQIVHIRVWISGLRILAVEVCFASAQLDVSRRDWGVVRMHKCVTSSALPDFCEAVKGQDCRALGACRTAEMSMMTSVAPWL